MKINRKPQKASAQKITVSLFINTKQCQKLHKTH